MAEPNAADSFMARWQTVPAWVLFSALVVVGAVSYLLYRKFSSSSSSSSETQSWQTSATSYLTSQGYSQQDASAATSAYANGQSLTPTQVSLIAAAIGSVGTPDSVQPNSAVTAQLANTPSTGPGILGSASAGSEGNAGGGTTLPGSPYPTNSGAVASSSSYWTVPVGAAGWSTTFNGIGGQFGVDPKTVQTDNPNLSGTLWGRIPQGSLVKVPRPSDS